VVTTSCNGASGVIRQGKEGWVIEDPRDLKQLKMAIKYFFPKDRRNQACLTIRDESSICSGRVNFSRMIEIFKNMSGHPGGYH